MTKRAFFLGLVGAGLICSLTYLNNYVLHQAHMVGNHFPTSVYGSLILLLLINAGIFALHRKMAFSAPEIAVILAMTLASCCIPSSGLLRTFTTQVGLPHHYYKLEPSWQKYRVLDEVANDRLVLSTRREIYRGRFSAVNGTTVTLEPGAPRKFDQALIRLLSGPARGQVRRILSCDAVTGIIQLDAPWRIQPSANADYAILENNEDAVLTPFIQGHSGGVPWAAWRSTLLFWIPLVLVIAAGSICLSLIVHWQWSAHEHLPYPLANMVNSLLPDSDSGSNRILRDRRFWWAFGSVFFIYLNNYVHAWIPERWVRIPTSFDFNPLVSLIPGLGWTPTALCQPTVLFTGIAVAYFLASDVSLSMGLAPYAHRMLITALAVYGINIYGGDNGSITTGPFLVFGAYLGMALMIGYAGRHVYRHILLQSFGMRTSETIPALNLWATRGLLICLGIMTGLIVSVDVSWPVALLYVAAFFIMLLVMGRIIAETGLFFIQAHWVPCGVLIGLLGMGSMTPGTMFALISISAAFLIDPRETLMPFMVNSAKLLDLRQVKLGRAGFACGIAVLLGLSIALPLTLTQQYKHGVNMADHWGSVMMPQWAARDTVALMSKLDGRGMLEEAYQAGALSVLRVQPLRGSYVWATLIGLALVVGCSLLRQRFTKFPLHPIFFLVWTLHSASVFAVSFLLGWAVKLIILKYGGSRIYQELKPIFIGLVAGELVGCVLPILFGLLYYAVTGDMPRSFGLPLG